MKLVWILVMALNTTFANAADVGAIAPPSVAEHLDAARAAIAKKGWGRALYDLQAAARQEPGNAEIHNLLGYTYRMRDTPNLPKAFEHYNKALEINPNHRGAHEYIGEAYLMDKKPDQAQKHLDALEKICGNKTCEEYDDLAKALAEYRKNKP
jgi:Flp pilus assembly protein TadD